ncbi:TPA: D-glutamate cyclase family protein, partial [Klebsiella pneumoniae]
VTPQAAVMASRVPFAVSHAPGHMFITDIPNAAWQQ